MTNDIQIFNYRNNEVRTVQQGGEPWFVLKDVCGILGIGNNRDVVARLDQDEKGVAQIDTLGGKQEMTIVNESGLYNVILRSDKPEAKQFRKWVTSEVLPTIRKTGAYMTPDTLDKMITSPEFGIRLLTELKNEQERRKALEEKVKEDAPAVRFANAITECDTNILIRDLAKLLKQNGVDTGEKRLYWTLRNDGYLIKSGSDKNMPTQKSMQLGLFFIRETPRISRDGAVIDRVAKVTPKGQKYFLNRYAPAPKSVLQAVSQ